ncbi:DUF1761 domain-containing protein [Chryseobacterium kimseyorum]|jgi:hypothetical protein|uniref:DUF1761 domain-containing protein n=1 Tax=Chryseobacterium kimseyorum TaxID=2984028 RepID=UPI0029D419F0|nr:DUF1761 domain-containing protein [Chryseobacterium kimseyorum]
MIQINFLAILFAALIPLVTGFVWYNPKVFGKAWMRESGLTEEKMKSANMGMVFIVSIILSVLIGFFLQMVTIHQFGAVGMVGGDPELAKPSYTAFMHDYGTAFRSFGHGALHSFITSVFFVFPLIAINAMFERKSWKYIFINTGYWVITITIMGGIICGWYAIDGFNLVTPK